MELCNWLTNRQLLNDCSVEVDSPLVGQKHQEIRALYVDMLVGAT